METAKFSSDTYNPDRLLGGTTYGVVARPVKVIMGQNLVRGAVLGKITASQKCNLSLSAAVDGSQTPYAILAEDCDATAADKDTIAYTAGEFNESRLTLGAAHTLDSIREGLRGLGIHLTSVTAA